MTRFRQLGWATLALVTLAVAVAGSLVDFPEPRNAVAIERAILRLDDGRSLDVTLPPNAADRRTAAQADRSTYVAGFDLAVVPDDPLFLLVPAPSHGFSLSLNDEQIFKSDIHELWSEPMVRGSSLVRLPRALLRPGGNELTFVFGRPPAVMPSYLTRLYVGGEAALAPNFRLRALVEDQLKTMALAAQALLAVGILIAFFYRPRDPLFSWLAAATLLALVVSVGLFAQLPPELRFVRMLMIALAPAIGLLLVGVALALVEVRPPAALGAAAALVPAASMLAVWSGLLADNTALIHLNVPLLAAAIAVATGIVVWGAVRRDNIEARLVLAPIFLLCWFMARDAGIILGVFEGSILLAPYARPLLLAAILILLMRRLAMSLDRLDRANENLNARLAQREAELAVLHREERNEAARRVREEERQRLTRDLHDGISGHLVSIIAMAERAEIDAPSIEQAARDALDDLRLVIYSLDLGDRELPLALANFRERLIPQLRRAGVELDWSTAGLPEVEGVTPGNALAILRVLQEAITNAVKHGPARRITIRGAAAPDDRAVITIENDGRAFSACTTGLGIENMGRRARQLGGDLQLGDLPHGLRVTLLLPRRLPNLQDAAE